MRFRAKMLFSTQIRRSLLMKKIVNENKKIKKEYKSIDYKNQNEMKWNETIAFVGWQAKMGKVIVNGRHRLNVSSLHLIRLMWFMFVDIVFSLSLSVALSWHVECARSSTKMRKSSCCHYWTWMLFCFIFLLSHSDSTLTFLLYLQCSVNTWLRKAQVITLRINPKCQQFGFGLEAQVKTFVHTYSEMKRYGLHPMFERNCRNN